jgi:elongation factor P
MAGVIDTSEFRKGMKIEVDGEPFEIVEFQHVKPGKGSAFVRTTIRSLLTGRVLQPTLKSGEKVGKPDIEEKDMQYLYVQGDDYYFMDTRNYEQTFLSEKELVKVTKCDPGVRGDTVSGAMKPATLESGYTVNVPLFINEGDILKIDTRDGKYLTRVATGG